MTLLFSACTAEDVYDRGLMAYWQAKHRNFKFVTTLTREQHDGLCGRIPVILPTLFKDLSAHSVFVAGSPAFVEDCVRAAKALGARDGLIHSEGYVSQAIPVAPPAERLVANG